MKYKNLMCIFLITLGMCSCRYEPDSRYIKQYDGPAYNVYYLPDNDTMLIGIKESIHQFYLKKTDSTVSVYRKGALPSYPNHILNVDKNTVVTFVDESSNYSGLFFFIGILIGLAIYSVYLSCRKP